MSSKPVVWGKPKVCQGKFGTIKKKMASRGTSRVPVMSPFKPLVTIKAALEFNLVYNVTTLYRTLI